MLLYFAFLDKWMAFVQQGFVKIAWYMHAGYEFNIPDALVDNIFATVRS